MLGIDFPGDRGGEQDRRLFLQPDEAVTKGRSLGRAIRADDRNQPPSFAEPRERGGDMAKRGASHRTFDVRRRGKGWIHKNDVGDELGIETVVDRRAIKPRDWRGGDRKSTRLNSSH